MSDVAVKIKKGTEIELNPEELRKLHEAMSCNVVGIGFREASGV